MEPKKKRPGTSSEMTINEYRRENQQGSAQVESAEINADQNLQSNEPVPTNDVDPYIQSGRVPGSPMDPEGLKANESAQEIARQRREESRAA
jgi:hypothetical protein